MMRKMMMSVAVALGAAVWVSGAVTTYTVSNTNSSASVANSLPWALRQVAQSTTNNAPANLEFHIKFAPAVYGCRLPVYSSTVYLYSSYAKVVIDGTGSEEEILAAVRSLIGFLPSNNEEAAVSESSDDLNRLTAELEGVTDVRAIAQNLADSYQFLETKKDFAKEMVTGFIRLDGVTTGIVGNGTEKLTPAGCEKAAEFVNFCDAFDIPVLSLTQVTGYASSVEDEKAMAKAAAELVYAFANATVPKINVILQDAVGTAYVAMNSKAIGADIVYAVEDARIGIMDADLAAKIIGGDLKETAAEFAAKQTALASARRGYVDELVTMTNLRKNVLIALEMLFNKREDAQSKKHGAK